MTDKRRTFDASFKLQVVKMITDQGLAVSQVCRDLIGGSTLGRPGSTREQRRYPAEQSADPGTAENPGVGSPDRPPGTGKIDIKKATALLMSEDHERTR